MVKHSGFPGSGVVAITATGSQAAIVGVFLEMTDDTIS